MRKRLAALTAALLVLCGCSAVQMERKRPEYAISVVLKAMNSHYWMDMRAGMEQAAVECGIDLRLLYPSGELEVEEQNDQIADVLESGTDLLMVAPCDSYHTKWFVDQAEENRIPVLAVDTRTLDCEIPYIGADNEKVGKMAADYLEEALPDGGNVIIFAGARNQGSQVDRVGAFRDELDPSLKISRIFYTDITMSDG
ncbi:MAG: substrate-binding domain-containing protein, partial [Butyricicoccaceae bacterium]